jgi:hypothetical protein
MTGQQTTTRTAPARRVGYLIGALVNGALLWALHVWPGWRAVPFLTDETPAVLGAVSAPLIAGGVVNLLQMVCDPAWLKWAGSLVTSAFGVAAGVRVLRVFPFEFGPGFDWVPVVRVLLVVGVVGAAIGVVVAVVQLVRLLGRPGLGGSTR